MNNMEMKRFSLIIKAFNTDTKRGQLNQVSTCQNQFYSTVTESTYQTSHHHARNGQFFRRSPDDRPALCRGPQVHQQGKGSKLTLAQGATGRWTDERDEQWASQKQVQSLAKESGGRTKGDLNLIFYRLTFVAGKQKIQYQKIFIYLIHSSW